MFLDTELVQVAVWHVYQVIMLAAVFVVHVKKDNL